ncbi:MAG: M20 family metallo-hydrolase [Bacteroidia bacterium]
MNNDYYTSEAVTLLKHLISIPSFSKEENIAADRIEQYLFGNHISYQRKGNNVWAYNQSADETKPTLLLNSHLDTVKPVSGWTKDPFNPVINENRLYGLGSNDAGGSLVSLLMTFLHFYSENDLPFNILFAATAEEEISGKNGIESVLDDFINVHFAIVGEPTQMKMAIAERGLLVLDICCKGISGHAARNEGKNAITTAVNEIAALNNYSFRKTSEILGDVKMNITMIEAGKQHNVIPDTCRYTADIRLNECYTHAEIMEELKNVIHSEMTPRSFRIKPSFIDTSNILYQAGIACGLKPFASPTTSDMALIPVPSIKIGPGDSARSHTADEFIHISEIGKGISCYITLLNTLSEIMKSNLKNIN